MKKLVFSGDQDVKKRSDILLCIACSLVPAVAVWLSYRQYEEFVSVFQNVLSLKRAFRTTFVLATIRFWPFVVVLGWLLLVPAMFGNAWARKFRVVLMCCYLVLGPVLYAICLHGLYDATMRVSRAVLQQESARSARDRSTVEDKETKPKSD